MAKVIELLFGILGCIVLVLLILLFVFLIIFLLMWFIGRITEKENAATRWIDKIDDAAL